MSLGGVVYCRTSDLRLRRSQRRQSHRGPIVQSSLPLRFTCEVGANNSMETEKLVMGKSCASTSVKLRQKSNDNCISGA